MEITVDSTKIDRMIKSLSTASSRASCCFCFSFLEPTLNSASDEMNDTDHSHCIIFFFMFFDPWTNLHIASQHIEFLSSSIEWQQTRSSWSCIVAGYSALFISVVSGSDVAADRCTDSINVFLFSKQNCLITGEKYELRTGQPHWYALQVSCFGPTSFTISLIQMRIVMQGY